MRKKICISGKIAPSRSQSGTDCQRICLLDDIPADSATLSKSRTRYFTQEELPGYMAFLTRHAANPASAVLELALNTGARIEEIADLKVGDYDKDAGTLLLRETKAGNDHKLGLGSISFKLLNTWSHGKQTWQPIFPSARDDSKTISHNTVYVFFRRSGLTDACPRDTRRTFKTLAQIAGISRDMLDIIQNHREGTVASKHYDKFYSTPHALRAMQETLNIWEKWLHNYL